MAFFDPVLLFLSGQSAKETNNNSTREQQKTTATKQFYAISWQ
jgi:hypothetical protein